MMHLGERIRGILQHFPGVNVENVHSWKKQLIFFCCHEKSLEYDEYDDILKKVESQKFTCITDSSAFQQNMLSRDVLCVDLSQYMRENWPLGDEELERTHKLYRLVSYRRCSR